MINSAFGEPAVIQIIIAFLSIYLLIGQGLSLICQQSLKTPLIYNSMAESWAGPGGFWNSRYNCNCQPSAQLVCWEKQCRGANWLQVAASKGCNSDHRLHWWDTPRRAPALHTSGTASRTNPNGASLSEPSLAPCPVMPAPTAHYRCAKWSEILKPHEWEEKQAAHWRGEKTSSALAVREELQSQLLHCYTHRSCSACLRFGCSQNNLLQGRTRTAWFNHQLFSHDSCLNRLSPHQSTAAGPSRSKGILQPLDLFAELRHSWLRKEVSSAPLQLWLQGFMLHLCIYIPILASIRRTKNCRLQYCPLQDV